MAMPDAGNQAYLPACPIEVAVAAIFRHTAPLDN